MSFSMGIKKWSDTAGEKMAKENKAIIIDLFSSVIEDTPVLTGRLRANWLISEDAPSGETLDSTSEYNNSDADHIEVFVSNIADLKDFDLYLTNNLPYAHRIEYDGWSHTKAPAGMVRKNLIRVSNNITS